ATRPQNITLFTRVGCSYCEKAKYLLDSHKLQYEVIELNKDITETSLQAVSNSNTVPQIFINGVHIGSAKDLEAYLKKDIAA
ncbi:MAG: glutaredoxin domain-containing protein, partial [Gammaproteobacteria bacterium]